MKKRLLVLIFMALVLSGCKKNNEVIADNPMVVVMSQSVIAECTIKEINANRFYCVINIDNTIYKEGDILNVIFSTYEYLESDKNHKIIHADTINYISGTSSRTLG